MNFLEKCKVRYEKTGSILCLGLDPDVGKFPEDKGGIEKTILFYFSEIISSFHSKISVVKPNMAFYEQYGIEGFTALKKIIDIANKYELPVILDAKRGDIGNTSSAYAKAAFEELKSDAITLSPYLGEDSLAPFFEYADRGFFVLARTSNKGSADFQLLDAGGEYLYLKVAGKIIEWNKKYANGIGAVAGATHPDELKNIAGIFSKNGYPPLLIPGVGKQGGDLKTVISIMKELNYPLHKIFINSSSKIIYAHKENEGMKYMEAVEAEINRMII